MVVVATVSRSVVLVATMRGSPDVPVLSLLQFSWPVARARLLWINRAGYTCLLICCSILHTFVAVASIPACLPACLRQAVVSS